MGDRRRSKRTKRGELLGRRLLSNNDLTIFCLVLEMISGGLFGLNINIFFSSSLEASSRKIIAFAQAQQQGDEGLWLDGIRQQQQQQQEEEETPTPSSSTAGGGTCSVPIQQISVPLLDTTPQIVFDFQEMHDVNTSHYKYTVNDARIYTVGCLRKHVPTLDYLTNVLNAKNEFNPPVAFRPALANSYYFDTNNREEALALGYDFFWSNAHISSCVESETGAVAIANDIRADLFNLTQMGAALYTLKKRRDITHISHVAGKKVGTNKISNLATHLCYDVLLRNGIHHLNGPKQTIFFQHSKHALGALLDGRIDVACGAIGTIEKYFVNETTGEPLEINDHIRILNPQEYEVDDETGTVIGDATSTGRKSSGTRRPFPFKISSQLTSQAPFLALPHVEPQIVKRMQQELFAMGEHANIMPSMIACLHDSGRGCLPDSSDEDFLNRLISNVDNCVQACFKELMLTGIVKRCDTTPQRAYMAWKALAAFNLGGFAPPMNNFKIRDIQESTGFLIKPGVLDQPLPVEEGRNDSLPFLPPVSTESDPECVRMKNLVEAVTCPAGHFARSSEDIIQQCNVSGLECYGQSCICSPCVEAFEVDFFSLPNEVDSSLDDGTSIQPATVVGADRAGGPGSGCAKFALCGSIMQEHSLDFVAIDNVGRRNATMTGSFLLPNEDEETFVFKRLPDGTFHYRMVAKGETVGLKVMKIYIDHAEIPESPFRVEISERDCPTDTGDARRVADEYGQCVCKQGTVEISGQCILLTVLIPSIVAVATVFAVIAMRIHLGRKRREEDNFWKINPEELRFDQPAKIIGRGSFGLVIQAEYRGTLVACKGMMKNVNCKTRRHDSPPDAINVVGVLQRQSRGTASVDNFHPISHGSNDNSHGGMRSGVSTLSFASVGRVDQSNRVKDTVQAKSKKPFSSCFNRQHLELRQKFVDEIRILSTLRHPCIATVMGAVVSYRYEPILVMELAHFGSLHDLLKNESVFLDEATCVDILHDISSGLRFLHSSDPPVIHGDLKSSNVLIDDKFRAKVADFGCSYFLNSSDDETSETPPSKFSLRRKENRRPTATGSPFWMAPELLRGESRNSMESDVYAFGMVFYEVFARSTPYQGEDYNEVLRLVSSEDVCKRPTTPENTPPEIAKMMEACLKWKPEDRPTTTGLEIRLSWIISQEKKNKEKETIRSDLSPLIEQNIPSFMIQALQEGRPVEPRTHECVTVICAHITGFDHFVTSISPKKLTDLLASVHSVFDNLCDKLDIFSVETVAHGSFLFVCNIEGGQSHHASLAATFAIESILGVSTIPIDVDNPSTNGFVRLRVGFHSGPIVSHLIGSRNSRFTLIGDTVNTAISLEEGSKPGKVLCSEDSYCLLNKEWGHDEFQIIEHGIAHMKGRNDVTAYLIEPTADRIEKC